MKKIILLSLLYIICSKVSAQYISNLYPLNTYRYSSCFVKDSNIAVIHPLPFKVSYLIELPVHTYVKNVEIDRNIEGIMVYVFDGSRWVELPRINPQTFEVNKEVTFLLVKCKEDSEEIYIAIQ